MGTTITFGKIALPRSFEIGVCIFEYGFQIHGKNNPIITKLNDWIDYYSPRFTHDQDVMLEFLSIEEIEFFYELLSNYIERGIHTDDIPLNCDFKNDLLIIKANTKEYIDSRRNGVEKQQNIST